MKLKDCRDRYKFYTGKLSDLVRHFGYAGIALIWLFREEKDGILKIPEEFLQAAFAIILVLSLDFLQYLSGSIAWGIYQRYKEKNIKHDENKEFLAPRWINWPAITFFWGKVIGVLTSYYLLLNALILKFTFI